MGLTTELGSELGFEISIGISDTFEEVLKG
jgi:hypothetical protein